MSKKRKNYQKDNYNIPSAITDNEIIKLKNNILHACAQNPNLKEHVKCNNFQIIFKDYNSDSCELYKINSKSIIKKIIDFFKEITKLNYQSLRGRFRTPPINKGDGHYIDLFKTIPKDTDLYHTDVGSSARIFYYRVANFFCIVSILNEHR